MLPVAPQAQSKLLPGGFTSENFPSQKARDLLQERFGVNPTGILFIVSHEEWDPYSPEFVDATNRFVAQLEANANVETVRSHLSEPGLISEDGQMAVIGADLSLDIEDSLTALDSITENLDSGGLDVVMTGAPPLYPRYRGRQW